MKHVMKSAVLLGLLLLPLGVSAQIKPYMSLNRVCIAEKQGNGYKFFNNNELRARQQEVFGKATRDNFEWFYIYKENPQDLYYLIVAKVYPQMRDAMIDSPSEEMKTDVRACPLTRDNQRLAETVTYDYQSKDLVCACLKENGKINCHAKLADLKKAPFEQWAPFYESGGYPSVIIGVVPAVVFKAMWDAPDDYRQRITPCDSNSTNDSTVAEYERMK